MTKAYQDLETQTYELETELEKVKGNDVSTQTVSKINNVLNVKQEQIETKIEEKQIAIPCKYFDTKKGCRRGTKCWFLHDKNHKTEKKNKKVEELHK